MTSLWFPHNYPYSDRKCIVPVILDPRGLQVSVPAVLDTGAWTSMFDKALAGPLGISDIATGTAIHGTTANGEESTGYRHDIELGVLGQILTVPVAFFPDWPDGVTNLLGMEGFFDQIGRVAFIHRNHLMYHE